jgi:hypothetical protein
VILSLMLPLRWLLAYLRDSLLGFAAWSAVRLFTCWPERWGFVRGLRDRVRLPWADGQMERALNNADDRKRGVR